MLMKCFRADWPCTHEERAGPENSSEYFRLDPKEGSVKSSALGGTTVHMTSALLVTSSYPGHGFLLGIRTEVCACRS